MTWRTLLVFCVSLLSGRGGGTMVSGGIPPTSPAATLSASSLGFGTELVGQASGPLAVTLTNSGTATLEIASIATTANFSQTNTCAAKLAPSANCKITVNFAPMASGMLAGNLSITDNAPNSPQQVSLTGNGTTQSGGVCLSKGQECPPQGPPCCTGLTCMPASTRAFCQ